MKIRKTQKKGTVFFVSMIQFCEEFEKPEFINCSKQMIIYKNVNGATAKCHLCANPTSDNSTIKCKWTCYQYVSYFFWLRHSIELILLFCTLSCVLLLLSQHCVVAFIKTQSLSNRISVTVLVAVQWWYEPVTAKAVKINTLSNATVIEINKM